MTNLDGMTVSLVLSGSTLIVVLRIVFYAGKIAGQIEEHERRICELEESERARNPVVITTNGSKSAIA